MYLETNKTSQPNKEDNIMAFKFTPKGDDRKDWQSVIQYICAKHDIKLYKKYITNINIYKSGYYNIYHIELITFSYNNTPCSIYRMTVDKEGRYSKFSALFKTVNIIMNNSLEYIDILN